MKCRVEATRFLELQAMSRSGSSSNSAGGGSGIGKTTDRPLWLRLDDLDAGTGVLADQPPLLIPIPYKPVFYDLAYDHIFDHDQGLKTLQSYIQEHGGGSGDATKNTSGGGGGFFGWFSSK
jgi:RNA-binding signal recognition particle 68